MYMAAFLRAALTLPSHRIKEAAMKKTYLVTERAGRYVAGQRKPENGRIELSDNQAMYELELGTIVITPDDAAADAIPEKKTKRRNAGESSEAPVWNETQPLASISTE